MIGVLAVTLIGGLAFLFLDEDLDPSDAGPEGANTPADSSPLESWTLGSDAAEMTVTWSESAAPRVEVGSSRVVLGPDRWRWDYAAQGGHHVITGSGDDLKAVWRFADGNPTAWLEVEAVLPASALGQDWSFRTKFSQGRLAGWSRLRGFEAVDSYRRRGHGSQWLRWDGGDLVVSVRGWGGDGVQVRRGVGGHLAIDWMLWDAQARPELSACLPELEGAEVTLRASAAVEFGELPPLVTWPYANGVEAIVAPVFTPPEAHQDPQLAEGSARSAADYASRTRTLAWGHSDDGDPRFGNGGLLGHDLGGTAITPGAFVASEAVVEQASELAPTPFDLSASSEGALRVAYGEELGCAVRLNPEVEVILSPIEEDVEERGAVLGPGVPARVGVQQLDGRRTSLLVGGLSRAVQEQALRGREVYAFATPLVATRNPLVGAAAEALLSPERGGQWTVAPEVASAFAELALWREAQPFAVASVVDVVEYWRFRDRAMVSWRQGGGVQLVADREEAMTGYTLAVPVDALRDAPSPEGVRRRVVETDSGPVALWTYAGRAGSALEGLGGDLSALGVAWRFVRR